MNLIKSDSFAELENISTRLDHIFGRGAVRADADKEMWAVADWMPSVDIRETEDAHLIKGEIPGVTKGDVKVTLQNGMLTIQGERRQVKEEKAKKFHRVECLYGSFMRSFRVPDDADESAVRAEFKDGVINITLPKSAKVKSKATEVSVS